VRSVALVAALAAAGRVDVALVPFWWLLNADAVSFVKTTWKPDRVVAFHFGTTDLDSVSRVEAAIPGTWAATRSFDSRRF
jgi:hypothetical protein